MLDNHPKLNMPDSIEISLLNNANQNALNAERNVINKQGKK